MEKEDIEQEVSELHMRSAPVRVSYMGNIITVSVAVLINSTILAFSYGSLTKEVNNLSRIVVELEEKEITPGAERRIAVLEAQVAQLRDDTVDWREELRKRLDKFEAKLDDHAARTRQ